MNKVMLAAGVFMAVAVNVASAELPSSPLLSELAMLTGPGAKKCGLVQFGENPATAWACARAADRQGLPYWFALELDGFDSDVWVASLMTPDGSRFILEYDSNYMGKPGLLPRFDRKACIGNVVLSHGEMPLQCLSHGP
jgi:hypothetical protein